MRVDACEHGDAIGMEPLERRSIGSSVGPQRIIVSPPHDDAAVDRKSLDRFVQRAIGTYARKVARAAQIARTGEMNVTIGQRRYDDRAAEVDTECTHPDRFFSYGNDALLVDQKIIAVREAARRSIE